MTGKHSTEASEGQRVRVTLDGTVVGPATADGMLLRLVGGKYVWVDHAALAGPVVLLEPAPPAIPTAPGTVIRRREGDDPELGQRLGGRRHVDGSQTGPDWTPDPAGRETLAPAARAGYAGVCRGGHPFKPGRDLDGSAPDDRWCDRCGEARRTGAAAGEVVDLVDRHGGRWSDLVGDRWCSDLDSRLMFLSRATLESVAGPVGEVRRGRDT